MAAEKRKLILSHVLLQEIFHESSDDDDDDEDDDDDITMITAVVIAVTSTYKSKRARHRQAGYIPDVISRFRSDEFKIFFRMSRLSVQNLEDWIGRTCVDNNISGILDRVSMGGTPQKPLRDRLFMLLWFLASQDKYASIADRFGASESTVSCSVRNLLEFIQENLLDRIITWPTRDEQQEIQNMYAGLKNFPGVIGMIDGSHIPIKKPEERGIDYYNRKDFYSVVLQAVVREDMRFTNVYTGWPGKVHDARVFRHSPLYNNLHDLCGDNHILADSAYPNLPCILTPFRDNGRLTRVEKNYNHVHSSIRSLVERAFAILKSRFRRLKYLDQKEIATMTSTVITACIIHNLCIMSHDELEDVMEMDDGNIPQVLANVHNYDADAQQAGACKRLQVAHNL